MRLDIRANRLTTSHAAEDGKSSLVSAAGELIDNAADASVWNPAEGLQKWVKLVFCETPRRQVSRGANQVC